MPPLLFGCVNILRRDQKYGASGVGFQTAAIERRRRLRARRYFVLQQEQAQWQFAGLPWQLHEQPSGPQLQLLQHAHLH
uniref:Uncharacterized protein n=1 Tax=uncultured bacterium 246 TaxID=698384 RepID=E3T6E4_9BACT|nr:hypothetical protein [uncultured bacterium 246]